MYCSGFARRSLMSAVALKSLLENAENADENEAEKDKQLSVSVFAVLISAFVLVSFRKIKISI